MQADNSLLCFAVACGLGVVTEATARLLNFWRYRAAIFPVLNILLMFGLIQGLAIARAIGGDQELVSIFPVLFMAGAIVGIVVEGVNEIWLKAWHWPETSLFGARSPLDKAALIGVAWGFVPVFTLLFARLSPLASRP